MFPETWLPGYPNHIWLGPVIWGMQFVGRYFENSVVAGSDHDRRLAKAAIAYTKAAADPAGHYSRPDVTRLMLNANPQRPAMAFDETSDLVTNLALDALTPGVAEAAE